MAKHNGKIGGNSETMTIQGRYTDESITCPSDYSEIVKQYEEKGMTIPFVRSYLGSSGKENIEMHIKLPYKCDGGDVWGYSVVSCDAKDEVNKYLRGYNTCEVYIGEPDRGGRNIEDVYPNTHKNLLFTDDSGKTINMDTMKLSDEIGIYAAAASNYPHVMTWDEFNELKTPSNEKFGIESPTEEHYESYLNNCASLMRDAKFIGEVTTPIGVDERRMSTPSGQQFLADMEREDQDRFMQAIEEFGFGDERQIEAENIGEEFGSN